MNDTANSSASAATPLPPDDLQRQLALARPETNQSLHHIGIVGDTYTILLSGEDTAGHYCLIEMYVPSGGGPAPHRHNFEESFTLLTGEIEVTFRGATSVVRAGETVNIPATLRTSSTIKVINRRGCFASAHRRGRKRFSWQLASPSRVGPPHPLYSMRRHRRRFWRKPKPSPPAIKRSCCNILHA